MRNLATVVVCRSAFFALAACAAFAGAAEPPRGKGGFDVRDYGAKGDGKTFDTAAIQRAIDECSQSGGGRVVVSGGTFLVKPFRLRSGVELHIAADGRILGSGDWRDYPNRGDMKHVISANLPRARDAALIWADEADRISITGTGAIDGNGTCFVKPVEGAAGKKWKFERIGGFDQSPPRVVFFAGCRDVTVKDVLLVNQPAGWGYWVHDCDRVVFDRCRIRSDVTYPNNDGIHINACRDVSISNCEIEAGDDAIVVRCNTRSLRERKPCERVTVRNCDLRSYANCIRIGWCREGTIRDCSFSDIVCHDSTVGVNIWFVPKFWNPAGDYGVEQTGIERISFANVSMERMHTTPLAVRVFEGAEDDIDFCRDISFSNVVARAYGMPYFRGTVERPFENFSFVGCRFERDSAAVGPWQGADKEPPQELEMRNCRGFKFDRCSFDGVFEPSAQ